jgi:hypothetical protein
LLHPYHPAEPGKKNRINQSDDQEIFTLSKLRAVLRHQTAIPVQEKKKPRTGVVLIRQPLVVPTNTMLKTEMSVTQATEFPPPKLPMLRDETQVEEIH